MSKFNADAVWAKYLTARKQQTPLSGLALRDAEKQQAKDGHHNEAKNITYEKATLQGSKSLPKE